MFENHIVAIAHWLDGFHDWVIYLAIAGITFIENLIPPFPGDVLTVCCGIYVRQGRIEFLPAYLWSVVGATFGFYTLFLIFRSFSHLLNRPFFKKYYPDRERERVAMLFGKYGGWLVVVNRFFSGVRSVVALVSAIADFPHLQFLLLTALGSAIYNYVLFVMGWAIGGKVHNIDHMIRSSRHILGTFGIAPMLFTTAVIVVLVVYFIRLHRKSRDLK